MRRQPIYIGNNRIVTFVEGDIPVVADSRSIDSMDLILGFEMEQHVIPIFRKLLRRNSVFVDVGANFGFYSAMALRTILPSGGKLFALEANPHTYEYLAWTIYANRGRGHPNVVYRNVAASHVGGRSVMLNFDRNALGGASLEARGGTAHQVAIDTVTLDDFIPENVTPTLIKIDVEGHEPHVIAGAGKLLARSPDITLIIECFDSLVGDYGVARFIDELRTGHGLKIYRAEAGALLRRLMPGEYPAGDSYIFASRLSLEGIDRAAFSFFPEDMHMSAAPVLFYGPYASVPRGRYVVRIVGKIEGTVGIIFHSAFGEIVHGTGQISADQPECAVTLAEDVTTFEIVAHGTAGTVLLERIDLTPAPEPITPLPEPAASGPPGFAASIREWLGGR